MVFYNFLSAIKKLTIYLLLGVTAQVNKTLIKRLDHPGRNIKITT